MKKNRLAALVQVSTASTSDWENGVVKNLEAQNLLRICKALEISADWLINGRRKMEIHGHDDANTEAGPNIKHLTPLISWVQAGEWAEIHDHFAPGDAEELLPCPVKHSPSTFVLRVRGESMLNPHSRPSFHDGDLIFVDPEREAINGSLVVVRLENDREATFKKLVIEGDRQYLRALNPAWPVPVIEVNEQATICGVVIFKGEKL